VLEETLMNATLTLQGLAARVQNGDEAAAVEMRRRIEPSMAVMARQVLRAGRADTPLAGRILGAVRRLAPGGWDRAGADQEALVRKVAGSLAEGAVSRLQAGWPNQALRDTVRL
jgi:hypothetical protein